ncbi:MAG: putative signal transducing protein [bacterium]
MFCPKCRTEYREGFYVCTDCNSDLVDELPPEEVPEFTEYAEVLGTYNPADVALIRSILDAENITYYFNAEHFMYVRPLGEPVRLMVKKDEARKAKEVLKDLDLAIIGIDLRKGKADSENGTD